MALTDLTRSQQHRVLTRAARAWEAGKPHAAWEILADAGMADVWPAFRRHAMTRARSRYLRIMSTYTA